MTTPLFRGEGTPNVGSWNLRYYYPGAEDYHRPRPLLYRNQDLTLNDTDSFSLRGWFLSRPWQKSVFLLSVRLSSFLKKKKAIPWRRLNKKSSGTAAALPFFFLTPSCAWRRAERSWSEKPRQCNHCRGVDLFAERPRVNHGTGTGREYRGGPYGPAERERSERKSRAKRAEQDKTKKLTKKQELFLKNKKRFS